MFNAANEVLIAVIVALLIVAIGTAAYFLVRRHPQPGPNDAPFGVVQASAFALVGLLLGFSFSLAVARFDQRRHVTVSEANAIGTTVLRTDLLRPTIARPMRGLLREYVQTRIEYAAAGTNVEARRAPDQRSRELQAKMWALAVNSGRRDPRPVVVSLFIESLNKTIDASAEQTAALAAEIPDSVIIVVIIVMLLAASLLGAAFGRAARFDWLAFCVFAVILALVVMTILDLDRPQRGFIKVPLDSLKAVQRMLDTPSGGIPTGP